MFAGFPNFCRSGAKIPIIAPTPIIPQRVAKKFLTVGIVNPPFQKMIMGSFYYSKGMSVRWEKRRGKNQDKKENIEL